MRARIVAVALFAVGLFTYGCGSQAGNISTVAGLLPQDEIDKIAFGSCTRQMQAAPLLNTIVEANPDLFLMLGDVIYPDINDEATALLDPWPSEETLPRIKQVYAQMAAKLEYQNLKKNVPMLAVWDDHDYGINDGSGDF